MALPNKIEPLLVNFIASLPPLSEFRCFCETLSEWQKIQEKNEIGDWNQPGIYIYINKSSNQFIKVGRHLKNSLKRALEHVKDNTAGKMGGLVPEETLIVLINLQGDDKGKNLHWIAALEVFFEIELRKSTPDVLKIESGRL